MKGQIYLITAVIVIVILVTLKTSLDTTKLLELKRHMEISLEREQFQNIKHEIYNTVSFSSNQSENINTNVDSFVKYARDKLRTRTYDLNGVMVETIYPTVSSGVNTRINVSVLNLQGMEMKNLNLSFSYDMGSNKTFSSVKDEEKIDYNFTFNTISDVNYTLTVFYTTQSKSVAEEITIPVIVGKSKYILFTDLLLKSNVEEIRDKYTDTFSLE
ncbi:MAG: hypothetical protein V1944_01110 [Candidatus Aenigmatarchaeota archaeon]